MRFYFIFLILINFLGCALKPSANSDSALENLGRQNLVKRNELSEARQRFKVEINKSNAQIQSIYKEQLQIHSFPDHECIGFQFQISKDGVVKQVQADKADITSENNELVLKLVDLFRKIQFYIASSDYSAPYKFCFHK